MRLPRIDRAIDACSEHIASANAGGTEIEAYLAQYLLIVMCAAFEEHIESLVHARIAKTGDAAVAEFARSATRRIFHSTKTSEIAGLLGRFGSKPKEDFNDEMRRQEKAATFFNNIVTNRNEVAHASGCQATFGDVVQFYTEGHVVLDAFSAVLESTCPPVGCTPP